MSDDRHAAAYGIAGAAGTEMDTLEPRSDSAGASANGSDVDLLGKQIERTRAEMAQTIGAIQEKLDPQALKQQAQDAVRAATIGRVESAVTAADENVHRLVHTLDERTSALKDGAVQQARRAVDKVRAVREPEVLGYSPDQSLVSVDEQSASGQWTARSMSGKGEGKVVS